MRKPSGPNSPPSEGEGEAARQLRRMTRRGFAWGGAAVLAGVAGWKWMGSRTLEGGLAWPLRDILQADEKVGRAAFNPDRLAPGFAASESRMPRVNGRYGIDQGLDLGRWRLRVEGPAGAKIFTLEDVKALPRFVHTTELKCIEGWSDVVTWAGARLVDLAGATGLALRSGKPGDPGANPADLVSYVALETPNRAYYVGLDIASALHPQTLLCYEMNGEPLQVLHGAPLRLAIPVKYGIKNLKQIGKIRFGDARPADYWAELGYDWYAGL